MLRFGSPVLWAAFASVPVVIILIWLSAKSRKKALSEFGDNSLVSKLTDLADNRLRRIKHWMLVIGFFFLSIGLVAPKIGTSLAEVRREGINLILLLDTSLSMNAGDVRPNRLQRAKYESNLLIDKLRGDRIGLVAFAGVSYLQCPLTLDYRAAKMFLDVVDTDLIPSQGTALGDAIQTGLQAFDSEGRKYKAMVIFSDGEDHMGEALEAASQAADEGVAIYTVGVGTVSGAPIPVTENGTQTFKRDQQGRVVTTRLDASALQEIAATTGGKFYQMNSPEFSADQLYSDIFELERTELSSHEYTRYEERYQYFLAIALIFFIGETLIPERQKKRDSN